MPTSLNGRADTVGPAINLGSFLPERRVVQINGLDHDAWVTTNRRYPRRVQAKLDQSRARYLDVVAPFLNPPEKPETEMDEQERAEYIYARKQAADEADEAYQRYVTDALLALIPTLDEETAELIDTTAAEDLLQQLGYFSTPQPVAQKQPSTEASTDADPLTGDTSSPDSLVSTQTTDSTDS